MNRQKLKNNIRPWVDVAIVGMAGKFPGAGNVSEFWNNLINKKESISLINDEELLSEGFTKEEIKSESYIKAKGVIDGIEFFDASFFGYSPNEALYMDPQIRLFHECVWHALEDAGHDFNLNNNRIGLYAGASNNTLWEAKSFIEASRNSEKGKYILTQVNNKDHMCTLISYRLNLKGPSLTLQSNCSTSLVAVHLACQALLSGDCDTALAGGITIRLPNKSGYHYDSGLILSADGHCRSFDDNASGSVFSNGMGVVVLKRVEDAIRSNDNIYAIIKGSAINNDGDDKVGYTAPSIKGQTHVIKIAQRIADVSCENIDFVEAHGSATPVGDIIEVDALKKAFSTTKRNYCAIGSVKTNIGHLDNASGVTGLIKAVKSLQNKVFPPNISFNSPNSKLDINNSPFFVNADFLDLSKKKDPIIAGVSSFGQGGTNVHLILEEAIKEHSVSEISMCNLLILSAKSEDALENIRLNLIDFLSDNSNASISDVAYTLQIGRKFFAYRQFFVCTDLNDAIAKLKTNAGVMKKVTASPTNNKQIVFMFSGLGSQYLNMGLDLYKNILEFKLEADRCFSIAEEILGYDIRNSIFQQNKKEDINSSEQFQIDQLYIFIIEYALAKLMINYGVTPDLMIGYSFGEYVVAAISEIFSLKDALKVVIKRGKLIGLTGEGKMLSVPLSTTELKPFLNDKLSIAIDNRDSCILSGSKDEVLKLETTLKEKKLMTMCIDTRYALHSSLMQDISDQFLELFKTVKLNKPKINFISSATGTLVDHEKVVKPEYWLNHLINTVQFSNGIEKILSDKPAIILEIGPGNDLCSMISRFITDNEKYKSYNLLRNSRNSIPDTEFLYQQIGQLWSNGLNLNWKKLHGTSIRQKISLPGYPFAKEKYWIDSNPNNENFLTKLPSKQSNYLYASFWKPSINSTLLEKPKNKVNWLIFVRDKDEYLNITENIQEDFWNSILVKTGSSFQRINEVEYTINPLFSNDYCLLFDDLRKNNNFPDSLLHAWNIEEYWDHERQMDFDNSQNMGFYSLFYISKAISNYTLQKNITINILTNNVIEVLGDELLFPEKSTIISPVNIMPIEFKNLKCRLIDVNIHEKQIRICNQIKRELQTDITNKVVAYRNNKRFVQQFESFSFTQDNFKRLKTRGSYLITGGLGSLGLLIADYLSENYNANIILLSRSGLPERNKWNELLSENKDSSTCEKIQKILNIEKKGGKVFIHKIDISNKEQLQNGISKIKTKQGVINGIFHLALQIDGGIILTTEKQNIENVFSGKVKGIIYLLEAFKNNQFDVIVLYSSMSSIIMRVGTLAYAAANVFLDSYAKYLNSKFNVQMYSINWDFWSEVGSGVENIKKKIRSIKTDEEILDKVKGITPEKGIQALDMILKGQYISQVIVNSKDLLKLISDLENNYEEESIGNIIRNSKKHARPQLSSEYVSYRNDIEKFVTELWMDLLGYDNLGVKDDFFEIGGDSLKSILILSEIQKKYRVSVSLNNFYKNPTVEYLAQSVSVLKKVKIQQPNIKRAEKKKYYAASSSQKRMYIIQQIGKNHTLYNDIFTYNINGVVDINRLKTALNKLVKRHEILRTSFYLLGNSLYQIVNDNKELDITVMDSKENDLQNIIAGLNKPYDLSKPPFFRITFISKENIIKSLIFEIHHIISDSISNAVFMQDLIKLYNNKDLGEVEIQYKDFSEWQNRLNVKQQEKFWLNSLKGFEGDLKLLYDTKAELDGQEAIQIDFVLRDDVYYKISEFTKKEGVNNFITLISAFYILLHKYTNCEDIVIGSPVTGRNRKELMEAIGFFINVLPLRNRPLSSSSIIDFINVVKQNTLEAFDNQEYQIDDLIDKLRFLENHSGNLFNVIFNLYYSDKIKETPVDTKTGFDLAPQKIGKAKPRFHLRLVANESNGKIYLTMEYNTGLFSKQKIERMISDYQTILNYILADSNSKISEIKLGHALELVAFKSEDEFDDSFIF